MSKIARYAAGVYIALWVLGTFVFCASYEHTRWDPVTGLPNWLGVQACSGGSVRSAWLPILYRGKSSASEFFLYLDPTQVKFAVTIEADGASVSIKQPRSDVTQFGFPHSPDRFEIILDGKRRFTLVRSVRHECRMSTLFDFGG